MIRQGECEPQPGKTMPNLAVVTRAQVEKIVIDGKRYEAASEREFVPRGARVRVIGKDGPELIVRPEED